MFLYVIFSKCIISLACKEVQRKQQEITRLILCRTTSFKHYYEFQALKPPLLLFYYN